MSLERGKFCKGSTSHTDTESVVPLMLLQGLSWPDSGCRPCSPAPWPQLLILHAPTHPSRHVANYLETHRGSLSPRKEDLSLAPTLASGHNVPAWPGLDTPRVDTHPICRAVRTLRLPGERGQEPHVREGAFSELGSPPSRSLPSPPSQREAHPSSQVLRAGEGWVDPDSRPEARHSFAPDLYPHI